MQSEVFVCVLGRSSLIFSISLHCLPLAEYARSQRIQEPGNSSLQGSPPIIQTRAGEKRRNGMEGKQHRARTGTEALSGFHS